MGARKRGRQGPLDEHARKVPAIIGGRPQVGVRGNGRARTGGCGADERRSIAFAEQKRFRLAGAHRGFPDPHKREPSLRHPAVVWTPDVTPYFLRKVRILNAAHTALIVRAIPRGHRTVLGAIGDRELVDWLERLLFGEVVPVLEGRVEDPQGFARQTLERFRNPFLRHKLSDIALHHATKKAVRLVPTREEYVVKFGRTPPMLDEVLAAPPPG